MVSPHRRANLPPWPGGTGYPATATLLLLLLRALLLTPLLAPVHGQLLSGDCILRWGQAGCFSPGSACCYNASCDALYQQGVGGLSMNGFRDRVPTTDCRHSVGTLQGREIGTAEAGWVCTNLTCFDGPNLQSNPCASTAQVCLLGQCRDRVGQGQPCYAHTPQAGTTYTGYYDNCQEGLYCNLNDRGPERPPTCAARMGLTSLCSADHQCASSLQCWAGRCNVPLSIALPILIVVPLAALLGVVAALFAMRERTLRTQRKWQESEDLSDTGSIISPAATRTPNALEHMVQEGERDSWLPRTSAIHVPVNRS